MFSSAKKLMRLGIVSSSYPLSSKDTVNAGVFVRDLAHELAKNGHEVHVLTPFKHGRAERSEIVSVELIPWWGGAKDLASLSMQNPLNLIRFSTLVMNGMWSVNRYARVQRLDALLAMWAIPSGLFSWWTWRRSGIPYGVWALGSDIWARRKYPFGDFIVRRVLKDAQFRFADGIRLAGDVERLVNAPCAFVPSMRQLPTSNQNLISPDLTWGVTNFLFIGRFELNKGPDILIEAMRLLLDRDKSAHLYMFGDGSLRSHLQNRVRGYEHNIHLQGYADLNTVMSYMSTCDWLVIPSRIESIPLIFMDAMQMRLPVIAADVGDLGTLVRRFGVGKVVAANDPEALAADMQSVQSEPRVANAQLWKAPQEIFNLRASVRRVEEALLAARTNLG